VRPARHRADDEIAHAVALHPGGDLGGGWG
jgi:hypothetical protein